MRTLQSEATSLQATWPPSGLTATGWLGTPMTGWPATVIPRCAAALLPDASPPPAQPLFELPSSSSCFQVIYGHTMVTSAGCSWECKKAPALRSADGSALSM